MSERDLPARGQPAPPEEVTDTGAVPDVAPGLEEPEADFIEQHVDEGFAEPAEPPPDEEVLLHANEADASEQRIAEPPDEEEHD